MPQHGHCLPQTGSPPSPETNWKWRPGAVVQPRQEDTSRNHHRANIRTSLDPFSLKICVLFWWELGNYINDKSVVTKYHNVSEFKQLCARTLSCSSFVECSLRVMVPSNVARLVQLCPINWTPAQTEMMIAMAAVGNGLCTADRTGGRSLSGDR